MRLALQARGANLQRAATGEAEAASVLATAELELQRLSSEETNASRAVAIVQRQAELRAGQLGDQARRVQAICQQERAA